MSTIMQCFFKAYATTMSEGHQLVKALEQQAQMMHVDNRETVNAIERLIGDIGSALHLFLFSLLLWLHLRWFFYNSL